ncbi:MAG: tRNA lysidine(34) synthetase TilS [Chloroflexi bacterium]|nr:tRNA lysidine(34) synthetase TilS [Chloroflexota bacterium]
MSDLIAPIDDVIRRKALFQQGQSILVAVSGGVDSMVLLRVLHQLSAQNEWRLAVAHFNHQLRGRSSAADERFVQRQAAQLRLRCCTGRGNVREYARKHGLSVEMAGRNLRHRFLARTAVRLGIKTIALAHHADDQVELFFLRLLRGRGGEGLSGMKWSNPSPVCPQIQLARPLLASSKAELLSFARDADIPFREDASNARLEHDRNRLRHELLPLIRTKYQPGLTKTTLRLMEVLSAETDFVRQAARRWLHEQGPEPFERLHPALQRHILRMELLKLGITPEFDLIERLRCFPNQPTTISPRRTLTRDDQGRLCRRTATRAIRFKANESSLHLTGRTGRVQFDSVAVRWEILPRTEAPRDFAGKEAGCEYFDAEKVGSPVLLRHWRPGDRFQPIGMRTPVKLQDLLTNQKVPQQQRHELVVATTVQGTLFWVEGLRVAETFKLDKRTLCSLKWEWHRAQANRGPA